MCGAFDDPEPKHGGTGAHGAKGDLEPGDDEDPRGKHRALDKKKAKAPPKGPPLAKPAAAAPKKVGPKGVGKSASAPAKAKAKPSASSSSTSAKAPVALPPPPKPPPPSAVEIGPAMSSLEDAPPRLRAPRRQKEDLYINAVGPGKVFRDDYQPPDGRPMYGNWNMKCPYCPKVNKCERTQGEIPVNFPLGLGQLEVIAFLHAWRDVTIDPALGHRKTNPTPEQIRRFHDNHRAELQALRDHFVLSP